MIVMTSKHTVMITLTLISKIWRGTGTGVVIDSIPTRSSVQTGITGTFVELCNKRNVSAILE